MATVSDKNCLMLTVVLLVPLVSSGCSALMPSSQLTSKTAGNGGPDMSARSVVVPTDNKSIPRQRYNSAGEKVPYVAQPNPYTTDTSAIPQEAKTMYVAASSMLSEGDLKGAHARFQQLTVKFPSLSGPWVQLGAIAEKNEDYDEAINLYEKAISVNKRNINAYIALGLTQRKQGNFSAAQKTYLNALHVWKDFPEAHLDLAILYDLYVNNPVEAQKHYEAYYFLTGGKDEKVRKWLVEVRRRTGIESSFIDIPPNGIASVPNGNVVDDGKNTNEGPG